MKILGAIVFYNPDSQAIHNAENLIKEGNIHHVIILDNSAFTNLEKLDLKSGFVDKVTYVNYKKNLGIAQALHDAMEYAKREHFDYVLTLDQDSIFPFDKFNELNEILQNCIDQNVGILALNYNNKYKSKKKLLRKKMVITSGNFINVKQYEKINGFNVDFFIDYVDFDVCRQFYEKKIRIYLLPNINMNHTIGNPIYKRILFVKLRSMNASLIRYYYRFRNEYYCYKRNKKFYFFSHIKEKISILIMMLVEKNCKEKKRMIYLGIKNAKNNILGEYLPEEE